MSVHVKAFSTNPETIHLETDEASVRDAIGLIRLTFNRNTHAGRLFVEINGKRTLYDPWFLTFMYWYGSGWCQLNNPTYFFERW